MSPTSPRTRHVCAGCHKELLWPGGPAGSSEPPELGNSWSESWGGASEGGSYAWNGRCGHVEGVAEDQAGRPAAGLWRSAAVNAAAALKLLHNAVIHMCRRRMTGRH
jgi:hypothetical protein